MENEKSENKNQIVLKDIILVGDKAIISIDDNHHFLVEFNKFAKAKEKFFMSEDGKIVPCDPLILFDSYNVESDGSVRFLINCKVSKDSFYSTYNINGFLDKDGNVSNYFYVETPDENYDIFISKENAQTGKTIVYECFDAIKNYYEPYLYTDEENYSKTLDRLYN